MAHVLKTIPWELARGGLGLVHHTLACCAHGSLRAAVSAGPHHVIHRTCATSTPSSSSSSSTLSTSTAGDASSSAPSAGSAGNSGPEVMLRRCTAPHTDAVSYQRLVISSFNALAAAPDANADPIADTLARRMLAHAHLRRGQRVLDLATGTGLFAVAAGRVVGSAPGGVLALDVSPGMVELARRNVRTSGLRNIEVREADVEATDLPPASYDLITASAALPYMHRPGAALARWRRWLRPNGRLVANSFKSPYDPECGLLYELAAAHGLGGVLADPLAAVGGDGEGVRRVLEAAGYKRVQVTEESMEVLAPAASAREYAEAMWASSVTSPHHCLEHLLSAQQQRQQQRQGHDSGSSSPGGSAALSTSMSTASTASASSSAAGPAAAGQWERGGAGVGAGRGAGAPGVSAAAMAAAAAAGASASAAVGAGASRAGKAAASRGPAKALGGGPALAPKLRLGGSPGTQQALDSKAAVPATAAAAAAAAAAVPASVEQATIDPGAVQRLKDEFLSAAERSAKKRLRSGAVRTTVHVLWVVAYAS